MIEDLLAKLVLGSLPLEKFETAYADDVGDPELEVCQQVLVLPLPKKGLCTLYLLRGGLTVVEDAKGRWSCFENRDRVEEREHFSAWACFARGCWVSKVPTESGTYPTRTLEGHRAKDRELKMIKGRLRDVTPNGGFQTPTEVSSWRGEWYSHRYPNLRNAL